MQMIHPGNFCKVLDLRPILLHILPARVPKRLCVPRYLLAKPARLADHVHSELVGRSAVSILGSDGSWRHFLKADNEDAVGHAATDELAGHHEACGAGGARVVHIVDRDLRHAELVEDSLATSRIAVAVACYTYLDVIIVDAGIEHCFAACLEAQFGVVHKVAWFDEAGEAIACVVSVREEGEAFWYNRVPSLPMTYAGARSMLNKVCA